VKDDIERLEDERDEIEEELDDLPDEEGEKEFAALLADEQGKRGLDDEDNDDDNDDENEAA
jgi:hypothetical protein